MEAIAHLSSRAPTIPALGFLTPHRLAGNFSPEKLCHVTHDHIFQTRAAFLHEVTPNEQRQNGQDLVSFACQSCTRRQFCLPSDANATRLSLPSRRRRYTHQCQLRGKVPVELQRRTRLGRAHWFIHEEQSACDELDVPTTPVAYDVSTRHPRGVAEIGSAGRAERRLAHHLPSPRY